MTADFFSIARNGCSRHLRVSPVGILCISLNCSANVDDNRVILEH